MAKLYWRIKKDGKWTWQPAHWLAEEPVRTDGSRLVRIHDWQASYREEGEWRRS